MTNIRVCINAIEKCGLVFEEMTVCMSYDPGDLYVLIFNSFVILLSSLSAITPLKAVNYCFSKDATLISRSNPNQLFL